MRSLVFGLVSMMTLACSQWLPVPDPIPAETDAGPAPCGTTETLAGRCIESLGEGLQCPTTPFSTDHSWANNAELRFVEQGGTGDGRAANAAAGSIAEALTGITDSAVILLGAGHFEPPAQLPAQTTLIGRCASESVLTINTNTVISRAEGQSLRLWGIHVDASSITDQHTAIDYIGSGHFETHQTRWSSGANAIAIQGTAVVHNATFGTIGQIALGVRGPLSSVIVGDNHFLGPISGEGVFLGPISGEGVFRLTSNTFAQIDGNALSITDATSSVIVGDNHFLGPISGEGVFVGPASADLTIQNNRFERVSGSALVVQDISGGGSIMGNTITAQEGSTNGVGIAILDATGAALNVANNSVTGATQSAMLIVRTSAEVTLQSNTLSGTQLPAEVGGDDLFGYGAMILDSGHITLLSNTINNHPTAGVLYDLERWGKYIRRSDLSGDFYWNSENNSYANNNQHNEVSQHTEDHEASGSRGPNALPSETEPLPTNRQTGRSNCGDGRTSGAELCDPNDPTNSSVCTTNCTFTQDQRSASGSGFSCFIGSDHHVYCVASNQNLTIVAPNAEGLAPPNTTELLAPTRVELGNHRFVAVAAGEQHACALTIEGQVICWGNRDSGAVGDCGDADAETTTASTFVTKRINDTTGRLKHVRSLSAYEDTTCSVTSDHRIFCWGARGADVRHTQARLNCATEAAPDHPHLPSHIRLGNGFACTRSTDGEVACWGNNGRVQLGRIDAGECSLQRTHCSATPHAISVPASNRIATGQSACSLSNDRTLYCWGPAQVSQSDFPLPESVLGEFVDGRDGVLPGRVEEVAQVTMLGIGTNHGCIVESDRTTLKCWGTPAVVWSGSEESEPQAYSLQTIPDLPAGTPGNGDNAQIIELTVGPRHTCTVREDRRVRCWGYLMTVRGFDVVTNRSSIDLWGLLP